MVIERAQEGKDGDAEGQKVQPGDDPENGSHGGPPGDPENVGVGKGVAQQPLEHGARRGQGGAHDGGQNDPGDADGEDDGVLGRCRGAVLPQKRKQVDPVGAGDGGDGRHGQKDAEKQGTDAAHPKRGHRLARLDFRCDGKDDCRNGQKKCKKEEPGHRNLPRG